MLDFTAARVHGRFVTPRAELFMFQFSGNRLFVDAGFVVLHLAFLTGEVNVGILSAWHMKSVNLQIQPL